VLLLKQDTAVRQRVAEAASLYASSVALGELYYGAEHSIHVERSRAEVDQLAQAITVLNADSTTAKVYGYIKHMQRSKGLMLPDNDLWIAATAIQYGITLAARDHHFTWIAGLALAQW
jgi:tRNA(fMet)-specific endonuclease VapC